jgi:hypothetical protein
MLDGLISLILLSVIVLAFGTLAYGAVSAAPWVPLRSRDVKRLLQAANLKGGEVFIDLGSGDGRILTAAARQGAEAVGYEVALVPYAFSQVRRLFCPQRSHISIRLKSFWSERFDGADVIACFLTPPAMVRLQGRIPGELKKGARFVTYAFPLPDTTPSNVDKPTNKSVSIYTYTKT